jgi:hypothetical protein
MTLKCCKERVIKEDFKMGIEFGCDGGDIFMISGKRQIFSCNNCSHRIKMDDLIELFPEKRTYIELEYPRLNPTPQPPTKFPPAIKESPII